MHWNRPAMKLNVGRVYKFSFNFSLQVCFATTKKQFRCTKSVWQRNCFYTKWSAMRRPHVLRLHAVVAACIAAMHWLLPSNRRQHILLVVRRLRWRVSTCWSGVWMMKMSWPTMPIQHPTSQSRPAHKDKGGAARNMRQRVSRTKIRWI